MKFPEHRVADRRIIRLIQKWLNTDVLEDGRRTRSEVGTVQGGNVSPLLANVYLHYVFERTLSPAVEAEASVRRCGRGPLRG